MILPAAEGSNGVILQLAREGCDPEDQWVKAFTTKLDPKDPHYRKTRLPWVFLCTHALYTHAQWYPCIIICIINMCNTPHKKLGNLSGITRNLNPWGFEVYSPAEPEHVDTAEICDQYSWTQAPLKGCIDHLVPCLQWFPQGVQVIRDHRVLFKRLFHRKTLK